MLTDNRVDVKDIEKLFGINITNPEYKVSINNSFRDKAMIITNSFYRRHRKFFSKVWKEDILTKNILDADHSWFKKHREEYTNAADKQISTKDGQTEDPFFKTEYIRFSEFLPKESLYDFKNQLKKFKEKYVSSSNIGLLDDEKEYDDLAMANRYRFETQVTGFMIDSRSDLGLFFSSCDIRMESASLSFVLLSIRLYLNEDWIKKTSDFAVNKTNDYDRYYYLDKIKIKNVRTIEKGSMGADVYKKYVLACIFEEMKYRARNILRRYFEFVTRKMNSSSIVFMYIETNIGKNTSGAFWRSIDIYPEACYLSSDYDACISFLGNNIVCINRFDERYNYYGGIFQNEIPEQFNQYIAFLNIKAACNEQISVINKLMRKCQSKTIDIWLELWKKINENYWYIQRFLNEYNINGSLYWEFINSRDDSFLSKDDLDRLNRETKNMNGDISSIMEAIEERISAKNLEDSHELQHQTFVTNFVSAILAFFAIVISIALNDSGKKIVSSLFSQLPIIPVLLYILCVVIVIYVVFDMIRKVKHFIERKWFL